MIRYLLVCIFSFLLLLSKAQVSGIVMDMHTKQAISNATIYIDGLTQGTTSNEEGKFTLEKVSFPCQLIVSHISYQVQSKYIKAPNRELTFYLEERLVRINEFKIVDKNVRAKNLKNFKDWFLGNDFWGRNAEILNDSVLYFTTSYDSCFTEELNDSLIKKVLKTKTYKVDADRPILVRLPLTGYTLRIDLLDFRVVYNNQTNQAVSSYLGYFHFIPFKEMSRRNKRVFTNNRRKAFYNSRQHFGRSLIEGKLAQNGYELRKVIQNDSVLMSVVETNLSEHIHPQEDIITLTGLKGETFYIRYYSKFNSKPHNLTKRVGEKYENSQMKIMNDTAFFYSSGNTPNRDVMYTGAISNKKVGAALPATYSPTEDLTKDN